VTEAAALLHLLKANPTLLNPVAGTAPIALQMRHRGQDEIHNCLRCGQRAAQALIADTKIGPRWVDLCMGCVSWLHTAAFSGELK
jgi:hypothetical protein